MFSSRGGHLSICLSTPESAHGQPNTSGQGPSPVFFVCLASSQKGPGPFGFTLYHMEGDAGRKKDLGSALNLCNEVYHSNGSRDYKHCERGCLYILYDHHPTAVLVCSKQQRYQPRTKLIDKATRRWTKWNI